MVHPNRFCFDLTREGLYLLKLIVQMVTTLNFVVVGRAFIKKKEQSDNINYGY